ncbi:MAG: lipoate--protein ligase [Planctomycetota bacterium]|nr:lipoate--protein ligase [Planctomycetota bacterium]
MASAASELSQVDVIVDEAPNSGVFNMSMDAALLQLAAGREHSVVRIYEWAEPTVTLGYFQGAGQSEESPFPSLPVVRRLSGGGAILHDHEITYSLVLPASHPSKQNPSVIYETVHRAIIRLLFECGVKCLLRSEFGAMNTMPSHAEAGSTAEPFLCFLRQNPNDIVHQSGTKVVGSAQRRRKGVTLQHGSIILKASEVAPQVQGIEDLGVSFRQIEFRQMLPIAIAEVIGCSAHLRQSTADELSLAATIAIEMKGSRQEIRSNHAG